ncbi:MAG: rRNA pseudouridine synthase [Candidatus Protistobacter heckmanni]|nr:rRNA pseudouridine synthase [Candidatus Protistobacter heckmanni]
MSFTRIKRDAAAPGKTAAGRAGKPAGPQNRPAPSAQSTPSTPSPDGVRLSKRMAELGLCSRREADEWIAKGWVKVDGKVISELGTRIQPSARIEVAGVAKRQQQALLTVLIHKPVGYVSGQAEDGHKPAWMLVTPDRFWQPPGEAPRQAPVKFHGLAPAGRLDIDSTGLLVMTQDGRVAKTLIGEHSEVEKEYLVRVSYAVGGKAVEQGVDKAFPAAKLALLRHGLSLDGVALRPAKVDWQNGEQLRFILKEGRNRQIRRMCEAVGLKVVGLKRVRIGKVALGALPPGKWRLLREGEAF